MVKGQKEALAARNSGRKEAAQARGVNALRRPAYLLSGLLECDECGGNHPIVTTDRYGCIGHHLRSQLHQQPDDPAR